MIGKKLAFCAALLSGTLLISQTAFCAELNWVGCGITKKAFMEELSASYTSKTGVTINLQGGGATKGIRETVAGNANIGGSCRSKMDIPSEQNAVMTQVAWDALVVIVNKANPIQNITSAQVKDLLKGNIRNWKELGGNDAPVNLYIREGKTSGVGRTLRLLVYENADVEFSPAALVQKSSGPVEKGVLADINGIGVSGVSSAKKRPDLKIITVDSLSPNKEILMSGDYPYFRPLFLVTNGEPQGEVKKFIDYSLSEDGQSVISKQGTINLAEGRELKNIAELEGLLY